MDQKSSTINWIPIRFFWLTSRYVYCFSAIRRCYCWVSCAAIVRFEHAQRRPFSNRDQSRSQSLVPLDQRSKNESSGSIHFEITMGNNRILVIRFTAQSQSASISCYGACLKWLLPELSISCRRPEGSWALGTRMGVTLNTN